MLRLGGTILVSKFVNGIKHWSQTGGVYAEGHCRTYPILLQKNSPRTRFSDQLDCA
jgi:hypothetical protein